MGAIHRPEVGLGAGRGHGEGSEFMRKIALFEEVDVGECYEVTGKAPATTKWVDLNKGTMDKPDVRCRLVARDFKPKGEKYRADLFAAMPPLECKKYCSKRRL